MTRKEEISRTRAAVGRIGGKRSAASLTPEQRRDRAKIAVAARESRRGSSNKGQ